MMARNVKRYQKAFSPAVWNVKKRTAQMDKQDHYRRSVALSKLIALHR